MAKAAARPKKIAAKSKSSVPVRGKVAPPPSARTALKKGAAKPAAKPAGKPVTSKPALEAVKSGKWVFTFGDGKAEGKAGLRDLLGGKGANLAEMANLGLPVPPGFTIPTSVCTYFYAHDKTYPKELKAQVENALDHVGRLTGKSFGDPKNPLLVQPHTLSGAGVGRDRNAGPPVCLPSTAYPTTCTNTPNGTACLVDNDCTSHWCGCNNSQPDLPATASDSLSKRAPKVVIWGSWFD